MRRSGWLHVITGPMFSGKTEELIRILRRYEIAGLKYTVYRPALDTRSTMLESRNGLAVPATFTETSFSMWNDLNLFNPDVIAVDEAQFFDNGLVDTLQTWSLDKPVIVVGLDKDFAGRPFGPMPGLLAVADEVTKLTAICSICHEDATMTQRLLDSNDTIVVGGFADGEYTARCRIHHRV